MKQASKDGFSILGLGVAACLACCAGPILAFLGGLGLAGIASTLVIGAAGLAIMGVAIVAAVVVRRRRRACAVPGEGPVPVTISTRSPTPQPPTAGLR